MKKIVCIISFALIGICQIVKAQKLSAVFNLTGKLTGAKYDSILVDYIGADGNYTHATAAIENNTFTITGNIIHPSNARILIKKASEVIPRTHLEERTLSVYLEPGAQTLTGIAPMAANLKLTGSKTQAEYDELNSKVLPIRTEMKPLVDEYTKEKDHEKAAAIRDKFEPYQNRIKKVSYQFFLAHPISYVTADQIKYYTSSLSLDSIKRVYDCFNSELKGSANGKQLAKEIRNIESGSPGNMAFVFTKEDINGKTLSLSDFKGKYVMLDFWASWCVPCRQGNPHMITLYNKYKSKGFEIIGIADDDTKHDLWKAAVEKDNVGIWRHVLRGLNMDMIRNRVPNPNDLDEQYGIHTIPTKILIDPTGKIIGRYGDSIGGTDADMDKMLASLFK